MALVGVVLSAVVIGGVLYRQRRTAPERPVKPMTLHEALWVTERDFSRFYAPGTPESRSVANALTAQDASVARRQYERFILYRRGLSDTDAADEPVLALGFDPTTIPAGKR